MQISVRKVNPVKAFRQPDAAIGSHQTTPAQLMEYQEDGPAVNMPLPSVAASIMPSPLVAESPVSSELRNTDHVVPLEPVGSNASYFLFPPAQAAMLRTETAQSDISCSAVPDSGNRQSPEPAKMAFESTYLPSARNDHAQHAALHPSSSFASASGGACLDSRSDAGGSPCVQTPSMSLHDLLPPMDFIFYKDPNPDWKNTREISVNADTSHARSLEHLASQSRPVRIADETRHTAAGTEAACLRQLPGSRIYSARGPEQVCGTIPPSLYCSKAVTSAGAVNVNVNFNDDQEPRL